MAAPLKITHSGNFQVPSSPAYFARAFGERIREAFHRANRELCPVRTGTLRNSFSVRRFANRVILTWTAPYAVYVQYKRNRSMGFADRIANRGTNYVRSLRGQYTRQGISTGSRGGRLETGRISRPSGTSRANRATRFIGGAPAPNFGSRPPRGQ